MNLSNIHTIYFIGIGGIGMSGLARYFNTLGVTVSGYDKTPSVLTEEMIPEGMSIHFEEDLSLIPKEADLVVYTPAIPVYQDVFASYILTVSADGTIFVDHANPTVVAIDDGSDTIRHVERLQFTDRIAIIGTAGVMITWWVQPTMTR